MKRKTYQKLFVSAIAFSLLVPFCIGASFLDSTKVVEGLKGQINRAGQFFKVSFEEQSTNIGTSTSAGELFVKSSDSLIYFKQKDTGTEFNLTAGAPDQNLYQTFTGDSGSTTASTTTDTLDIAGGTNITTVAGTDTVTVNLDQLDLDDINEGTTRYYINNAANGTFKEEFDATITSNGTTVTMSVQASDGGDLTEQFSSGLTTFDTSPTPATIALTVGTDPSPQGNWIYILQSAPGVLVKSTSAWPTAEHIRIGFFVCQSASSVQTAGGTIVNQNWNNALTSNADSMGEISHVAERMRINLARYFDGVDGNGTDNYLTPTAGNVEFKSTSGNVYQVHIHSFSAMDTSVSSTLHVKNWSGDAFHTLTNLYDIVDDSTGTTIGNNKFFNLIFWGVVNKAGEHQTAIINLPSGSYNTQLSAEEDSLGFDDFAMPREFTLDSSTGFLISRMTIQMKTGGGTWVVISSVDLRGTNPQTARGGAASTVTTFADNTFAVFGNIDNSKEIVFDVDTNITTATTRTYIAPDANGTLALTSQSDGTIVPASTTVSGIVELATTTEIDAGTDSTRAIPVDQFESSDFGKRVFTMYMNSDTALTTGDGKVFERLPDALAGWSITKVVASRSSGSGTDTYNLFNFTQGTDTLSTALTIDAGEVDSATAAVPPVINTAENDITLLDQLRADVDVVGTDTLHARIQIELQRIE